MGRHFLFLALLSSFVAPAAAAQSTPEPGDGASNPSAWRPPPPDPDDVRGLPVCAPDAPTPGPGERHTCRPPMPLPGVNGALTLDLAWGGLDAGTPVRHSAVSFATGVDFGLTRALSLGVRYQLLGGGEAVLDGDGDGQDDEGTGYFTANLFGAGPRLRLWTDETYREAWIAELDAGYAFVKNQDGLDGPYGRLTLGRQVGWFLGQMTAGQVALTLSYLQGFGNAREMRSVLFGLRLQPEFGVPLPSDIDEVPEPAGFAHTLGLQLGALGIELGEDGGTRLAPSLGVAVGFPVSRALEPRLVVDMHYFGHYEREHAALTYAGLAGARLRLTELAPIFVDAMAGYQLVTGPEQRPYGRGPVVDVATGLYIAGCGIGAAGGIRYRTGVGEENEGYDAITLFVELTYGNRRGALGAEPWPTGDATVRCGGVYQAARVPLPPPPPPEPAPEPEPMPTTVRTEVEARVEVPTVEAEVEVELEPVVIEVTLGYALFGGAVQLRIDPRSLPLDRLRGSGFVEVEVVGPAGAVARAEAQLRASLGPDGGEVDAWSRTVSGGTEVRAIFTLWPPGARP